MKKSKEIKNVLIGSSGGYLIGATILLMKYKKLFYTTFEILNC